MATPVKKTLSDVRKQISTGKSLRGVALSEAQISKLKEREEDLVALQEEQREVLQHASEQADRVITSVGTEICGDGDKTRDALKTTEEKILKAIDALVVRKTSRGKDGSTDAPAKRTTTTTEKASAEKKAAERAAAKRKREEEAERRKAERDLKKQRVEKLKEELAVARADLKTPKSKAKAKNTTGLGESKDAEHTTAEEKLRASDDPQIAKPEHPATEEKLKESDDPQDAKPEETEKPEVSEFVDQPSEGKDAAIEEKLKESGDPQGAKPEETEKPDVSELVDQPSEEKDATIEEKAKEPEDSVLANQLEEKDATAEEKAKEPEDSVLVAQPIEDKKPVKESVESAWGMFRFG